MNQWINLDKLASWQNVAQAERVDLTKVMNGEEGAERVRQYKAPMAAGLTYTYAAKQVDEKILAALCELAKEAQLASKFEELYNGAVINTGEKRLVLHHLTILELKFYVIIEERESYTYIKQRNTPCMRIKVQALDERWNLVV